MWIGCHADSHEYARWFGDDISVRRSSYLVDWSGLPYQRFLLDQHPSRRVAVAATEDHLDAVSERPRPHLAASSTRTARRRRCWPSGSAWRPMCRRRCGTRSNASTAADCPKAWRASRSRSKCASRKSPTWWRCTSASTAPAARWRWPAAGAAASSIPPSWTRSSRTAESLLAVPATGDVWATALQHAPDRQHRLDEPALDELLVALGDFVDLKCPFTLGHSRATAQLAADAAVGGRARRRCGRVDPPGRSHSRHRPHRRVQPDLVQARRFDDGGVRADAAAPVSDRADSASGSRPAGGGVGRRQSPRVPERLGVSARAVGAAADDAGPAGGGRGQLPVGAGAQAVSRGVVAGGRGAAAARTGPRRRARRGRRRRRAARGGSRVARIRSRGPTD